MSQPVKSKNHVLLGMFWFGVTNGITWPRRPSYAFLEISSTRFEVRSSPHAIQARGVERGSGYNGRDDLLREQIEGLDVVASDAAQDILEADVDERLYPLDGLPRRGRYRGLL